ncbi:MULTISPECIES: hypothetical protein [Mycolicibacterium]|uniref:Secreted protein n=3 Tax=Mycolicibacterium gilvum TaxID=1804 RepID=E6TBP4_MYCSR|nr:MULTISPECIES: hypothetical protein [Mycolicibacterium]ABP47254.1 hypothetical protein Mflv_4786 [Mycolicibacterium gilvum PYR-GCK]ADU00756.1 hypothetical protein Mspyr1_41950 [Mycolicibacterium gilvum Spyr1]MBV5246730.1 hypothetical protein [Mycolicibacterium sp. PAM1]MCV7056558.1 hypothetical protein [Mycolicibacterium gilvum]STZ42227.1 Uncharacterised protein [Mycolicibacterium gilvum]
MTRFSRFLATPLLSAAIFGATLGMAGTATAMGVNESNMAPDTHSRTYYQLLTESRYGF